MYDTLRQTLDRQHPMSPADWTTFESCLRIKTYAKQEPLLQAGQVCRGIWFVRSGAVRTYISKDGTDVHTGFSFEYEFVTAYESLTRQEPSAATIVALEPAETIYFSRDDLIELYRKTPALMQLGRVILENVVVQQSQYAALFTLYSPAERYDRLLGQYPKIGQRVPVQYIASYLGIARETLSRIRHRKG